MAGALQLLARAAGKQARRAATALVPRAATILAAPLERPISIAAVPRATALRVLAPALQGFPVAPMLLATRSGDRAREAGTVAAPARSGLALAIHAITGAQGGAFPLAVGHGDAHEPGGAAFLVIVGADAALTLNGGCGGAMLCVGDAVLGPRGAAFLARPLERSLAAATLAAPRATTSRVLAPTLRRLAVAPLLPAGSDDHVRVRAWEANAIIADSDAATVADNASTFFAPPLDHPFATAGAAPRVVAPTLQEFAMSPLLAAREADTVAAGAAPTRSGLALATHTITGAQDAAFPLAVGLGHRDAHEPGGAEGTRVCAFLVMVGANSANAALAPTLQMIGVSPLLPAGSDVRDAATVADGAAPNRWWFALAIHTTTGGRRVALEAGGAEGGGDCVSLAIIGVHSVHHAALNLNGGDCGGAMVRVGDAGAAFSAPPLQRPVGAAGAKEAAAIAGSRLTGRRGYSSSAGGGDDDDSFKPRLQNYNQNKIISKFAKLQFRVRRIEKLVLLHAKFSILHRREMIMITKKLQTQVRLLPAWILGVLLLITASTCYLLAEVVAPRVGEIASEEIVEVATQIKDLATEIDEDKKRQMATELAEMWDGGRLKSRITNLFKFWKWGKEE